MQKRILSLIALTSLAAPLSSAATYFLPGVSESGGWHDAEKQWGGVDDNMCWAAQAACMTQYWQDWFVKAGNTLPDGTPNGYGVSKRSDGIRSSNIFETYKANWTNVGGLSEFGLPWYFTGTPDPEYYDHGYSRNPQWSHLTTSGQGGYFSQEFTGPEDFFQKVNFLEHRETDGGLSIYELTDKLMDLITVEYSIVGLTLDFWNRNPMSYYGGHAVTLWGFDTDDSTGLVSAIYITDSDDNAHALVRYDLVTYYDGADIEMPSYLTAAQQEKYSVTIDKFYSLSVADFVAAIPEPSAFGLLAGVFAFGAGACARRRRRC